MFFPIKVYSSVIAWIPFLSPPFPLVAFLIKKNNHPAYNRHDLGAVFDCKIFRSSWTIFFASFLISSFLVEWHPHCSVKVGWSRWTEYLQYSLPLVFLNWCSLYVLRLLVRPTSHCSSTGLASSCDASHGVPQYFAFSLGIPRILYSVAVLDCFL